MSARDVVQRFCDLMVERDPDALRPFLAEDATYQNIGMPATTGVDAILENLAAQFAMFPDSYEYKMINIVAEGDVVMTERQDLIKGPDGRVHPVPVMGVFIVDDGKIKRWSDYWDTGLPGKMMSGEDYAELMPRY